MLVLARALHIGSALLLVSLFFFQRVILRGDREIAEADWRVGLARRFRRWTIRAFIVQLLSGAAWFWIVAADLNDSSLLGVLDPNFLRPVLEQTRFGQLWVERAVIALVVGIILFLPGKKIGERWSGLAASGFLLLSLAWAGHAAAGASHRSLHIAVDVAHLAIAAVWPVGLVPLALFLLAASGANGPPEALLVPLCRFSRISLFSVALLLATGIANALFFFSRFESLFTTTYGQLLLSKLALFVLMVGLAAMNRFSFLPGLMRGSQASSFDRLRRSVLAEALCCLLVVLIVGAMGATPPP
jgi:putative copper resistance protein D